MSDQADNLSLFSKLLRAGLGSRLRDVGTYFDMVADDAVLEFPYAPPGFPKLIEGKPAIRRHIEGLQHSYAFESFSEPVAYPSGTDTVILEFSCVGKNVQTGAPYNQDYISVIKLRDGLIAHYRDYWNPLVATAARNP
jgi:uncharacterized protein